MMDFIIGVVLGVCVGCSGTMLLILKGHLTIKVAE